MLRHVCSCSTALSYDPKTEVSPEQRSRGSRAGVLSGVCLDEESGMHRSSPCPGLELSMVLTPESRLPSATWPEICHPNPRCRVLAGTLGFLVCTQNMGASECCPEGRPNHPVLPFSHRGDLLNYLYTQCGLLDVLQTETASASQETLKSILPWM